LLKVSLLKKELLFWEKLLGEFPDPRGTPFYAIFMVNIKIICLPYSSARGIFALRNKKWQNSNLTCGTNFGGRSRLTGN
jgi:hypothetical protein